MIDQAWFVAGEIWPLALVFSILAIATKRRAIFAAIQRTRKEFGVNLGLVVINFVLLAPLLAVPAGAVHDWIGTNPSLVAFWGGLPDVVVLTAAILGKDFGAYWRHRLEHVRWIWPIHATHHADEALHWLSLYRKHPFSQLLSMLLDSAILFALGMPVWALAGAAIIRLWWGAFIHADLPWTLGTLGEIMISPAAHRLHHIRDENLMGSNYGNTFTLWDKLFGTYIDPKPYVGCETGIAEGTRGLLGELWRPFEARYWKRQPAGDAADPQVGS